VSKETKQSILLRRIAFEEYQKMEGWSDSELAKRMGVNKTQVWRVKEGHNNPGRDFIAGALKVFPEASFDELFYLPGVLRVRKTENSLDA